MTHTSQLLVSVQCPHQHQRKDTKEKPNEEQHCHITAVCIQIVAKRVLQVLRQVHALQRNNFFVVDDFSHIWMHETRAQNHNNKKTQPSKAPTSSTCNSSNTRAQREKQMRRTHGFQSIAHVADIRKPTQRRELGVQYLKRRHVRAPNQTKHGPARSACVDKRTFNVGMPPANIAHPNTDNSTPTHPCELLACGMTGTTMHPQPQQQNRMQHSPATTPMSCASEGGAQMLTK